uniref:Uncharacterized protein n=1 Tax=Brassica oleracea TaxID=3712 RepID=A0A3P6AJA2_BRAOL|nr:unnamed protein product [Brassica oleracea]
MILVKALLFALVFIIPTRFRVFNLPSFVFNVVDFDLGLSDPSSFLLLASDVQSRLPRYGQRRSARLRRRRRRHRHRAQRHARRRHVLPRRRPGAIRGPRVRVRGIRQSLLQLLRPPHRVQHTRQLLPPLPPRRRHHPETIRLRQRRLQEHERETHQGQRDQTSQDHHQSRLQSLLIR